MKIALVHDWLTGMRGGEKVLLEMARVFPTADIFTLFCRSGSVAQELESRVRGVSFLQHLPGAVSHYRSCLPLFPAAIRSLDLAGYDAVVSSSHAVAKSVRAPRHALHVSYIHTPMRYLWDTRDDYFRFGDGRWWKRAALGALSPWLRRFDRRTASGVDFFIANSENVRRRIRAAWGADAHVIYPPVDTEFFTPAPGAARGDYYLVVSSLEPYKRIDLAVDAFSGGPRRLLVAGKGTLNAQLRRRARGSVEFLGSVDDERLRDLYRHCRALILPGREDFGIVPVEAQACGRPVICYADGGALESVIDGATGVHFQPQSPGALIEAVCRFEAMRWNPAAIRSNTLRFSRHVFRDEMAAFFRSRVGPGTAPLAHDEKPVCK